ncbi:lysozyme [Amycolatopsis sp. NBC_00438]|uniref:lysozyme n=1 Tax=Amycolatopsis sp. NBC_00438 TaxID=2903558 RepID=UPI002E1F0921
MTAQRRGWRRLFGAALAVSTSLLVVTATGANAAPGLPDQDATGNHEMGAAIRAHDGVGVAPAGLAPASVDASVPGIDVSSYQGNVNWASYWSAGKKFAYVKATEGTGYVNAYFSQQYTGSYNVGMIHGAYHYGRPDLAGGAAQADYFVAHGGGWSKDGKTLPGTLDIEWGPNNACYGKTAAQMVAWIKAFSDEYHKKTTRWPVIYTATSWWSQCTGNTGDFSSTNPLWVARYASTVGTLPYKWDFYTFWQYSSSPIDQDQFSADISRLKVLATG